MAAIGELKARDIIVKINSIIIPGINDHHIPEVARKMADLNVDLFNAMPYYPNPGSALESLPEPSPETVTGIRKAAEKFVPQMRHCTRCRADAVGLLGQAPSPSLMTSLQNCARLEVLEPRTATGSNRPMWPWPAWRGAGEPAPG